MNAMREGRLPTLPAPPTFEEERQRWYRLLNARDAAGLERVPLSTSELPQAQRARRHRYLDADVVFGHRGPYPFLEPGIDEGARIGSGLVRKPSVRRRDPAPPSEAIRRHAHYVDHVDRRYQVPAADDPEVEAIYNEWEETSLSSFAVLWATRSRKRLFADQPALPEEGYAIFLRRPGQPTRTMEVTVMAVNQARRRGSGWVVVSPDPAEGLDALFSDHPLLTPRET